MGPYPGAAVKKEKQLSIIFIGRIHPIKNLDYLLELLPQVDGHLVLTIVGSEEDKDYTSRCKNMVAAYPPRIEVRFTGEIPNHQLPELIRQHHILRSLPVARISAMLFSSRWRWESPWLSAIRRHGEISQPAKQGGILHWQARVNSSTPCNRHAISTNSSTTSGRMAPGNMRPILRRNPM